MKDKHNDPWGEMSVILNDLGHRFQDAFLPPLLRLAGFMERGRAQRLIVWAVALALTIALCVAILIDGGTVRPEFRK